MTVAQPCGKLRVGGSDFASHLPTNQLQRLPIRSRRDPDIVRAVEVEPGVISDLVEGMTGVQAR